MESLANDVTRMPVTVSAEWHSTPVTTDPPRTAQHLEWRVTFLLRAPEPIYVAALLTHGGEMHWGLKIDEPAGEVELRATFSPWRFRTSEGVQVDFEGRRTRVTDAVLKQDARDVATITAPASTRTGEITEVLSMPGHAITLAFVAFAEGDTETAPARPVAGQAGSASRTSPRTWPRSRAGTRPEPWSPRPGRGRAAVRLRERDQALEQRAAADGAEQRVDRVLGMRHQAEDVAGLVGDARDVGECAVRVLGVAQQRPGRGLDRARARPAARTRRRRGA